MFSTQYFPCAVFRGGIFLSFSLFSLIVAPMVSYIKIPFVAFSFPFFLRLFVWEKMQPGTPLHYLLTRSRSFTLLCAVRLNVLPPIARIRERAFLLPSIGPTGVVLPKYYVSQSLFFFFKGPSTWKSGCPPLATHDL